MRRLTFFSAMLVVSVAAVAAPFQFTTPVPPGIAAPKEMPTRFGTLKFFDGVPDPASYRPAPGTTRATPGSRLRQSRRSRSA